MNKQRQQYQPLQHNLHYSTWKKCILDLSSSLVEWQTAAAWLILYCSPVHRKCASFLCTADLRVVNAEYPKGKFQKLMSIPKPKRIKGWDDFDTYITYIPYSPPCWIFTNAVNLAKIVLTLLLSTLSSWLKFITTPEIYFTYFIYASTVFVRTKNVNYIYSNAVISQPSNTTKISHWCRVVYSRCTIPLTQSLHEECRICKIKK
jgi:hypothetical protein